ncbi:MAG TPA: type IV secretion system DNA-binding domain-containing protein [Candidatus Binatia bacterium]|nr:type IV secretion system DNA-binding domain-containing protein [Candidatus Binatia bacterium]
MTIEEQLTEQFYRWELRGRGWQIWDGAVELEPPFRPFVGHFVRAPTRRIDDARKPTLLGSLIERFRRIGERPATEQPEPDEEPVPGLEDRTSEIVEHTITLPDDLKVTKERAERFLLALSPLGHPLSFELIGVAGAVRVTLACRPSDSPDVRRALGAYFPETGILEHAESLPDLWRRDEDRFGVVVDFGLSREFMLPLKTVRDFDVDPLISTVAALGDLRDDEMGVVQVLLQATRNPWAPSVLRAVTDGHGRSFFSDAPEILSQASDKIAHPFFAVVVRVAARCPENQRSWSIVRALGGSFRQFADPGGNELIPLSNDDYPDDLHEEDLLARQTRRSGMLLSADELVSLVHLPSSSVRSEGLAREARTTRAAAPISRKGIVLGENRHRGKTRTVTIAPELRMRHTYVVGASGTGKSTLLLRMILQDIENGDGVGVLDPHGDLIDEVLARIPESRLSDVAILDPSDEAYPVGFNVLEAHSEVERNLLSSDLVAIFRRFATSWGDQMTSVLGNAILAFLESDGGGSLLDLRKFLVDAAFRKEFLASVRDAEIVYYFEKEYPLLKGNPSASILTRLDAFLRPKLIRLTVGQRHGTLDLRRLMDDRKIFLAKLSQGIIGHENAHLLGALLVSKFHQAALSRQQLAESDRPDFHLYIDEFQNFATPSVASLLAEARKYHLGLVLAHQETRQIQEDDGRLASAVLTNPATRICFRVGDRDARLLARGFSSFDADDLQSLGVGEAICRLERSDQDFNLRTFPVGPVDGNQADSRSDEIVRRSREAHARPRATVELELGMSSPAVSFEHPAPAQERPVSIDATTRAPTASRPLTRPSKAATSRTRHSSPPEIPAPISGRGGAEHKYLQHLIKRLAEDRGWRATIEEDVLDGVGRVDVALFRDGKRIACEISVSTNPEHELANIQKCLAAGFDRVIAVACEKFTLCDLARIAESSLSSESIARLTICSPEEVIAHLDTEDTERIKPSTVRGYRVRVNYRAAGAADSRTRVNAISRVLAKGARRLR